MGINRVRIWVIGGIYLLTKSPRPDPPSRRKAAQADATKRLRGATQSLLGPRRACGDHYFGFRD